MRRFSLSERFKRKASAPLPTDIERPQEGKEPVLRKWLLRGVILLFLAGLFYFVFKDVIFVKVKGLVRPEKIIVQARTDGTFIAFASVGDIVEPGKVVGKIYNPAVESEIRSLKSTLNLLLNWRDKLEKENLSRKEQLEFNYKLSELSEAARFSDPETIRKELNTLYRERALLLESRADLIRKMRRVKKLIKVGAATELDLESLRDKLVRLESQISAVNSRIAVLREKLKKSEEFKQIAGKMKETIGVNPLLPNIASIDSEISAIKSRIEVLESKVSEEFISFPYKVKVASILPSGTNVVKGTQLLSVFNLQKYFVIAYVPPDRSKGIYKGERVGIVLPNGAKLKGVVEGFEPTLVLKPAVLVGPLEKRSLVLPVRIKILENDKEVRKIVYENMPVTIVFNR